jgi:ABC-type Fe3+/spermidine/putrescine transport system ATPase subunit
MSLRLSAVTKDYTAGGVVHRAVADLSLEIETGTFCTLLGPSGCGKTTLLRLIAGFERPTRGEILHNGRSLNDVPPYRRGFPMVFQSYALFPHMTVMENVAYGLRLRGLAATEIESRAARALSLLDIQTQRGKYPAQLSGGQQQRVALARCLVLEPEIILFDEPLSNLDAELRISMRREIRTLQQRLGITAVYVTHDQEEALAVSDRIVILNHGRIEQAGAPHDVFARPLTEFVARFMGSPNIFEVSCDSAGRTHVLGVAYECRLTDPPPTKVVIRSDAIVPSADGRHRARVAESTFLGARVEYVLAMDEGVRLRAELPAFDAAAEYHAGDTMTFDLAADRLHFLP